MLNELACADTGKAYSLWHEPLENGRLLDLIHAAVLAANAHNSQPWRFSIYENAIDVRADLDRHIGSFDPFRREMHQSVGCAIENLVQAAAAQGFAAQIETFSGKLPPQADDRLAARVRFVPAAAQDLTLAAAIPKRHTHRGAYDRSRPLAPRLLEELSALFSEPRLRLIFLDGARMAELGKLVVQSTQRIVADSEMAADSANWFRFHSSEVDERRDGLTLGANVPSLLLATASRVFPPSAARANEAWIGSTRMQVRTAATLGLIAVPDVHERALAIEVGRIWQRLHLSLTSRGIAAQPLNQPVECADRERALNLPLQASNALSHFVEDNALQAAFVFRAGYARRPACLSPRRPLAEVIAAASDASAEAMTFR